MRPFFFLFIALLTGFLAGHGFDLAPDLIPVVLSVALSFLALSIAGLLYEPD